MDTEYLLQFFAALGAGDFELICSRLHDDVIFEFPGRRFGGRFEGSRKVTVFMRQNQRLFRDGLRFTVSFAGVIGAVGVAQWTNEGVTRAGQEYRNRGVTVFRFEGERIIEIQDYLDTERLSDTWPEKGAEPVE